MILYVIAPTLVKYAFWGSESNYAERVITAQLKTISATIKNVSMLLVFSDKNLALQYTDQLSTIDTSSNAKVKFSVTTILADSAFITKIKWDQAQEQLNQYFMSSEDFKFRMTDYLEWFKSEEFSVIDGNNIDWVISTEMDRYITRIAKSYPKYERLPSIEQKLTSYRRGLLGFGIYRTHKDKAAILMHLNSTSKLWELFLKVNQYLAQNDISSQPADFFAALLSILTAITNDGQSLIRLHLYHLLSSWPTTVIDTVCDYHAPLTISQTGFRFGFNNELILVKPESDHQQMIEAKPALS
ncbi:MAG: hypothetical protein JSR33_00255 [Proteobacteria bacterium]|nr:hypothetical protein [Pseudomonadota bacterium]